MRRVLTLLAGAGVLALLPLTCHFAPALLQPPPGLEESRQGVIRAAREGLAALTLKYGPGGPDERWTEVDREVWGNLRAALEREGEAP